MANTLSGPNIEEEYLWSVTLDSSTKEYTWAPKDPADADDTEDEDEDPSCKPNHRLLVKTALLHPEAKADEVTMLQIETKGYKDEKIKAPFLAMKGGSSLQQYLDLLLPDSASIKIVSGSGPITLVGSHCVDFYDYRNYGGDDTLEDEEDGAESSEDDEMDMEEQETVNMKEDKEEDKSKAEAEGAKKKTPKKDAAPKKETPKKDSAKKDTPKKAEKEEESTAKSPKDTAATKKTPDSKKRKSSEEAVAEKKRKKSGDK